jgi:hypothetical protein
VRRWRYVVRQARRGVYRPPWKWTRTEAVARRAPAWPCAGDRIHRYVNPFCPLCHADVPDRPLASVARLSGRLVERDGRIWLEQGFPAHGLVRTLYDESAEILRYLEQWTAPTKRHLPAPMRAVLRRAGVAGVVCAAAAAAGDRASAAADDRATAPDAPDYLAALALAGAAGLVVWLT